MIFSPHLPIVQYQHEQVHTLRAVDPTRTPLSPPVPTEPLLTTLLLHSVLVRRPFSYKIRRELRNRRPWLMSVCRHAVGAGFASMDPLTAQTTLRTIISLRLGPATGENREPRRAGHASSGIQIQSQK